MAACQGQSEYWPWKLRGLTLASNRVGGRASSAYHPPVTHRRRVTACGHRFLRYRAPRREAGARPSCHAPNRAGERRAYLASERTEGCPE